MDDSGWQTVKPDNLTLIIRRIYTDTEFKILLSDIVRMWSVEGTAHDLLTMCQKENPLCEFDQSKVIKNIFNLFDKNLHSLKVENVGSTTRTLKMCANLGNMPFSMLWTLKEQSPDVLYKEITFPLLLTAQDLILRQDHLCSLLNQKDEEIMEYQSINGPLRRGRIKSEHELFVAAHFKADKFVATPQNRADPINFSGNSNLLSILNTKIDCSDKTSSNGVKIEPPVIFNMPEGNKSHSSEDLQFKRDGSQSQSLDVNDVKPKVENSENKDEEMSNISNVEKPKRRRKVKLNL